MSIADLNQVSQLFHGQLLAEPVAIQEKLSKAKAFVFDWDGVFNNGAKNENGSSPFSEVDSMGINMLRFNHYLRRHQNPVAAIITGEKNHAAYMFARREHFHGVYYNVKNKRDALSHLCSHNGIEPHDVAYFFDDVLDLSIAEICGLRIMIGNPSSPMLRHLVTEHKLADYITHATAQQNALREATELLMGFSGRFDDTILQRAHYSASYSEYITTRNMQPTSFFTPIDSKILEQTPQ